MLKLLGEVPGKHRVFFEVFLELVEAFPMFVNISVKFVLEDSVLLLEVLDDLYLPKLYLKFVT